jgi:hypothetical protein
MIVCLSILVNNLLINYISKHILLIIQTNSLYSMTINKLIRFINHLFIKLIQMVNKNSIHYHSNCRFDILVNVYFHRN